MCACEGKRERGREGKGKGKGERSGKRKVADHWQIFYQLKSRVLTCDLQSPRKLYASNFKIRLIVKFTKSMMIMLYIVRYDMVCSS